MTYCIAVAVAEGLIFASDSRTNAGADQVSTYGKMHTFGQAGERQFVVLGGGNLATTQAVIAQIKREIQDGESGNLRAIDDVESAAEYLGSVLRQQDQKHGEAVAKAGFSAEATFIIGGQVRGRPPRIYLVYPQGNYITSSEQTPYLQIGETKYGKAILDRIIVPSTTLAEAARCALVSMDSTIRSNATVAPPIEILSYRADSLVLDQYKALTEDDGYLLDVRRIWSEQLGLAFNALPHIAWGGLPEKSRFE